MASLIISCSPETFMARAQSLETDDGGASEDSKHEKGIMERETTTLNFFKGKLSSNPIDFFEQLYVPDMNRVETERIITERLGEKPDGIFILRDASQSPYPLPPDRKHIFSVSYWNKNSTRFNHLFICSDALRLNWSVLIEEDVFQTYPSLRDILNDIPSIRNTRMKNALVPESKKRKCPVIVDDNTALKKKKKITE